MKDQLLKALVLNEHVRLYIVRTTDLVQEAQDRFDLHPCACAALGRTLSVASMMGAMLKSEEEMLSITINGHGPIGSIVVDAYANGNVRGFVSNPHVEDVLIRPGKLNVGAVVGTDGTLTVTKDLSMEENFSGSVELQSGEIGDDFSYYFMASEQTPSVVSVGVLVDETNEILSSGGFIIQLLPEATEEDISYIEEKIKDFPALSSLIHEGKTPEEILKMIFDDVEITDRQDLFFTCDCSREKMINALSTIGKQELQSMIDEDHGCEITCQFCNTKYLFSEEELQNIIYLL